MLTFFLLSTTKEDRKRVEIFCNKPPPGNICATADKCFLEGANYKKTQLFAFKFGKKLSAKWTPGGGAGAGAGGWL